MDEPRFNPVVFAVVFGGWIFSLCVHEFSHALVAYYGGDKSVKEKGYLSFNPFAYAEPFGSVILPLICLALGGIGLPGGAVYIDRGRLRNDHWDCAVSLAGPLSNAVLLLALVTPFWLGIVPEDDTPVIWYGLACLALVQVSAIILNLLPVPPLDGFQALSAYMHPRRREWFAANATLFLLGLFVLLWRVPAANRIFWTAVFWVADALGLPLRLALDGRSMAIPPLFSR
jgi:Zn-dependent protease